MLSICLIQFIAFFFFLSSLCMRVKIGFDLWLGYTMIELACAFYMLYPLDFYACSKTD